jgi:hypothetical protein
MATVMNPNFQGAGPYIEYGPRETAPAPYISKTGRHVGLILKGDIEKIRNLCDTVLNKRAEALGSNVRYRPVTDFVLLFVGTWEGLVSVPMINKGTANENQASFWLALAGGHEENGVFHAEYPCLMVPYMFVDNPMSLLNGREVYGYQKSMSKFNGPPWNNPNVVVQAFGGDFARNNTAEWTDVVDVSSAGAVPLGELPVTEATELVTQLVVSLNEQGPADHLLNPATAVAFVQALLGSEVRQVFLKQFRVAEASEEACYQHILEASVDFEHSEVRHLPGAWHVVVPSPNSHPIAADLGIASPQPAKGGVSFEASLKLNPGVIVA